MRYDVRLSDRAVKDPDRLDGKIRQRVLKRLDQVAGEPHDPRYSGTLANKAGLRESRVGGWRIIFAVDEENKKEELVS